jgi:hypothetical protein
MTYRGTGNNYYRKKGANEEQSEALILSHQTSHIVFEFLQAKMKLGIHTICQQLFVLICFLQYRQAPTCR